MLMLFMERLGELFTEYPWEMRRDNEKQSICTYAELKTRTFSIVLTTICINRVYEGTHIKEPSRFSHMRDMRVLKSMDVV